MPEPRWVVEKQNYDTELAVAGFWPDGYRNATVVPVERHKPINQFLVKILKLGLAKSHEAWLERQHRRQRRRLLLA